MKQLMTKHFSKWLSKQEVSEKDLSTALSELQAGYFEASLGGHLYKKRTPGFQRIIQNFTGFFSGRNNNSY